MSFTNLFSLRRALGILYLVFSTSIAQANSKLIHITNFIDPQQRTTVEFFFSHLPAAPQIHTSESAQQLTSSSPPPTALLDMQQRFI